MTTATLGFAIDSSAAVKAKENLDGMTGASARAESASKSLSRTLDAALKAISAILQKIEQNTAKTASGLSNLGGRASETSHEVEKMTVSFGHADLVLQRMIDRLTGVARETREWQGPLANIGAEMDRLRAKFNPLFAASKRYEAELNEINYAHRIGAISAQEQAAALDMLNARYKAAATASQAFNRLDRQALNNSRQLSFQLIDIGQAIATAPTMGIYALQNLGFQIAQIGQLYMGRGGFNQAIKDSAVQVATFARGLAPVAAGVGVLTFAFAAFANEVDKTTRASVSMFDVMLATVQVIAERIHTMLKPAIQAVSGLWDRFTPIFTENLKIAGNTTIAVFKGSYDFIIATWRNFPAAMGDVIYRGTKAIVGGVVETLHKTIIQFNNFTQSLNEKFGTSFGRIGADAIKMPVITNPYQGTAQSGIDAFTSAFNTDYIGGLAGDIAQRAREIAAATDDAAGAAGRATDAWEGLRKVTGDTADKLRERMESLGSSIGGIFRGLLDKTMTWKDAAIQAVQSVFTYLNQRSLDQTGSGLFGGGLFGSILGGLFGFARGGYTGNGSASSVAGVVHGGEYVFSKRATDRIGVHNLETMHRSAKGYASGGYVASNNNMPGASNQNVMVDVRVSVDDDGKLAVVARQVATETVAASAPSITQAAKADTLKSFTGGGDGEKLMRGRFGVNPTSRRAG